MSEISSRETGARTGATLSRVIGRRRNAFPPSVSGMRTPPLVATQTSRASSQLSSGYRSRRVGLPSSAQWVIETPSHLRSIGRYALMERRAPLGSWKCGTREMRFGLFRDRIRAAFICVRDICGTRYSRAASIPPATTMPERTIGHTMRRMDTPTASSGVSSLWRLSRASVNAAAIGTQNGRILNQMNGMNVA